MRFECLPSLSSIEAVQNRDGGWGYRAGSSWTEPTVYALLCQIMAGSPGQGAERGIRWLKSLQRPDGGWPPRPSVDQTTWVTALAVLLLAGRADHPAVFRAVEWLLARTGRETSFLYRLRMRLLGLRSDLSHQDAVGWPWYPETAAWVTPTALTILALEKVNRRQPSNQLRERIEMGRKFLLSRMCEDGGWNHGSAEALGYQAGSYPETTGVALLALHGVEPSKLEKSFAAAERHLRTSRAAAGLSWLQLGLLAHSRLDANSTPMAAPCRTVIDASLCVLAEAARNGRHAFLE